MAVVMVRKNVGALTKTQSDDVNNWLDAKAVFVDTPPGAGTTFTLVERLGVAHADQIIEFDYPTASSINPATTQMVLAGTPVPFQVIGGNKIAVRTAMSANTTKIWTLQGGTPSTSGSNNCVLTTTLNYYQVTNGLIGVRVFRANGQIGWQSWGPIQGVFFPATGLWSPEGNRKYNFELSWGVPTPGTSTDFLNAVDITTTIIEQGLLRVVILVHYTHNRPYLDLPWEYACQTAGISQTAPCSWPAGAAGTVGGGYHDVLITMEAGQPSIMIEDDTDMNFYYDIEANTAMGSPDRTRYRGYNASDVTYGRKSTYNASTNPNDTGGPIYDEAYNRPSQDALRDFTSGNTYTTYHSALTNAMPFTGTKWMASGIGTDCGFYWMIYNQAAAISTSSPVFGAFAGRASKIIGGHVTGAAPYFAPVGTRSGFRWTTQRRGPDLNTYIRSRDSWGIFVGNKSADLLLPTTLTQPIGKQMNLHGGLNLSKYANYVTNYGDSSTTGGMFMSTSLMTAMINRIRGVGQAADTAFKNYLLSEEGLAMSQTMINAWADPTGVQTTAFVNALKDAARTRYDTWANTGSGIYEWAYHYWIGGIEMSRELIYLDACIADPLINATQKAELKAILAFYAYVLYDNDFVPIDNVHANISMGTANMPIQMVSYRLQYGLYMSNHPGFASYQATLFQQVVDTMHLGIMANGIGISSPHYIGASTEPTICSLLQVKQAGSDKFATETRLTGFAEFYMQLLTPPEVRFQKNTLSPVMAPRKLICLGDGSTEGTNLTGLLATGFRDADPTLSARLQGAWREGGKVYSFFFGSTAVKINEAATSASPALGNANFTGYYSILRNAYNTNNETAIWLINGNTYADHAYDEKGSLVMYALKCPLSINYSTYFSPSIPDAVLKSTVIPASIYTSWNNTTNVEITHESGWTSATNAALVDQSTYGVITAICTNTAGTLAWTRKVYSIHPTATLPIIVVQDSYTGANAAVSKIHQFYFMAKGAIVFPSGSSVTPVARHNTWTGALPNASFTKPSATTPVSLAAGLNRFQFSGQDWAKHSSGGIDFEVWTYSTLSTNTANVGNWSQANEWDVEKAEYVNANGVSFAESQHILRIQGTGTLTTIILPYNKGSRPTGLTITKPGAVLLVNQGPAGTVDLSTYGVSV